MPDLPTGTVTFLFTDIERSTDMLQRVGDSTGSQVITAYRRLLQEAFDKRRGQVLETQGDGFLVVFQDARAALLAALGAQQAIKVHLWPDGAPVRVRMALHTGTPTQVAGGYVGLDLHRAARICEAGWGGQVLLSQASAGLIVDNPPADVSLRDLGFYRLKDLLRPEKIFQLMHRDLPSEFPPLRSLDRLPNNLPIQLTSFIGREREMQTVKELMGTTRLLTLMGPGGAGKTRLALQVAADLTDEYEDGVWLVELASRADPTDVPEAVGAALRLQDQPGRPMTSTLAEYLRPRRALLLLDNCEHIVAACALLANSLLRECPHLRILATSRQSLRVGETTWLVPPFTSPDPEHLPPMEHLAEFEAIRLFQERAAAVRPDFRITERNASAVAKICHRLDGIPLAIELAAARVNVLSVEQIAARLDDVFHLLTGGSRTALPHHQTLRATMDWSHDLLLEAEKVLFRRLAVFAGCTLEAAEAVCAGPEIPVEDVFDLVSQLIDKSLLVADHLDSDVRYRMLEIIRQHALQKLAAAGEEADVRGRHRDWFVTFTERAEAELVGPAQAQWVERLEADHDNFRSALARSLREAGPGDAGLRLAVALGRFWWMRGHFVEGRRWLETFLKEQAGLATVSRVHALLWAGRLAWNQSDYATAGVFCEQALALARELDDHQAVLDATNVLGLLALMYADYARARALYAETLALARRLDDKRRIAFLLNNLGLVCEELGEYAESRAHHEESLALSRARGEQRSIANSLHNLGRVATAVGDHVTAKRLFEESLDSFQRVGYRLGVAHSLRYLGLVAYHQGDMAEGATRSAQSLALARELGDKECLADVLDTLGRLAFRQGDVTRATALWTESLDLYRTLGDKPGLADCLERFAGVASARENFAGAARLLGAAHALREAIRAPLPPGDRGEHNRLVATVRSRIGDGAYEDAWVAGQGMAPASAVSEALAEAPDSGSPLR